MFFWKVKFAQSCLTLCNPMDHTVHGILQARILERVAVPFSRGSSQSRGQTQVSHIAGEFFIIEPQGKPKNTGVGSLFLCQWIFLSQELNQGLLHCRQILYQLSFQGSHPLAFFMIQQMLAIWSLVPLPLQNPACTSGSSQFMRTFRGAKSLMLHYRMPKDMLNKQVIKVLIYYSFFWI